MKQLTLENHFLVCLSLVVTGSTVVAGRKVHSVLVDHGAAVLACVARSASASPGPEKVVMAVVRASSVNVRIAPAGIVC